MRSFEIIQQDVKAVGDFDRDTATLLLQLSILMIVVYAYRHTLQVYLGPLAVRCEAGFEVKVVLQGSSWQFDMLREAVPRGIDASLRDTSNLICALQELPFRKVSRDSTVA